MEQQAQQHNENRPQGVPEAASGLGGPPNAAPGPASATPGAPEQRTKAPRRQWPLRTVIITGAVAFVVAGGGGVATGWAIGSVAHDRPALHHRPAGQQPFHAPGDQQGKSPGENSGRPTGPANNP
ncbi:hypothetical protein [Psychromicrobium sp. YIM B11713]|uniref:hypothetical protein n=1 Tax=Psychromicrobium sp. YIM B11713 TaxID=3145233 RepID=UPI00374E3A8D